MTMTNEAPAFEDVRPGGSPLEDGRYILKLVKLEMTDGEYGPSMLWYFNVADAATKAIIRDNQGEPYEFHQYSSRKLSAGTKGNTWACALLNREIQIGESGAQIARDLMNTKAIAMVGPNPKSLKPCILSIKPFSTSAAAAPPPVANDLDEL